MNRLLVVFAALAVFGSSSWNIVDCAPFHWLSASSSTTTINGNTITETNVNGHRQVLVNGRPVGPGMMPSPGMNMGPMRPMGPMGPGMYPGMGPMRPPMGPPMGPMRPPMGPMGPMSMGPMG